jgi:hypothetical protein
MSDKVAEFRARAAEAEAKAANARTEETGRAWLIVARDWNRMADRLEARLNRPTLETLEIDPEALLGAALGPKEAAE